MAPPVCSCRKRPKSTRCWQQSWPCWTLYQSCCRTAASPSRGSASPRANPSPTGTLSYLLCLLNRVFFTARPTHVSRRIGDVGPRQEAKASLQFSPSRAGATVLLVNFDSDKLNSIKSSINVDVREWASDAALLLFTFNFYSPFLKCLPVSVILTFLIYPLFTLS